MAATALNAALSACHQGIDMTQPRICAMDLRSRRRRHRIVAFHRRRRLAGAGRIAVRRAPRERAALYGFF
jgi:hypothetical protein